MIGSRLSCLFNRHRPARETVEWNGSAFIGTCKHCSARIQRQEGGGWRLQTHEHVPIYKTE